MAALLQWDNPVFLREWRRLLRRPLLVRLLCLYVLLLGLVAAVVVIGHSDWAAEYFGGRYGPSSAQRARSVGPQLFRALLVVQGVVALFGIPAVAAVITRRDLSPETFAFLATTGLRARTYVTGVFLSCGLFGLLALLLGLPLWTLAVVFGGVSRVLEASFLLASLCLLLTACGILGGTLRSEEEAAEPAGGVALPSAAIIAGFVLSVGALRFVPEAPDTLRALGWPLEVLAGLGAIAVAVVLLLMAARKVFVPGERIVSYTQFAVAWVLVMGVEAGLICWRIVTAPLSSVPWADLKLWLVLYWGLGYLATCWFIGAACAPGTERWRLVQRNAWLRRVDDRRLMVFGSILAGVVTWAAVAAAVPAKGDPLWAAVLPPAFQLAALAGVLELASRWGRRQSFAYWGVVLGALWFTLRPPEGEWLGLISPLAGAVAFLDPSTAAFGMKSLLLQAVLAVVVWCIVFGVARWRTPEADSVRG